MAKPFDEILERPKYSTKLLGLKENSGNHMTEFTHRKKPVTLSLHLIGRRVVNDLATE